MTLFPPIQWFIQHKLCCQYSFQFEPIDLPLVPLGYKGTTSVRRKKSSMASKATRALKRAEKEGLLLVCKVDENFTSKVCCLCREQSNECKKVMDGFSGREIFLWGMLQCQICKHNWDRDKNACTNTLYLEHLERNGDHRPEVFTRSMPYTPLTLPSSESSVHSMDLDSDDSMDFDPDDLPEQQLTTGLASLNL